ncbi:cation diffusion facilitator family transporter [Afipia felis]|uniref:Protein p34 n=2 Tax=Afipia felis TaxID=1035 RepID=A0A380W7Q4_AFIFE|nr:cation diffusion facilitator family transporter [Afipia felis]EKS28214.1 cation diffusion facilitator family transporter [Afipia felis ATCC 53690]SUU76924.1 Ferrous-iron efflux pump FieF [Afipia felis]SUU84990.1 Ferrous-iron efflux pump FieF [Afipia felis]
MGTSLKLAAGSIVVGCLVLALKYAAYYVTGSVALYSDALESILNVATAVAAFIAVRVSATPPDANHPYGHQKAEYLSAIAEGVLILAAALAIFYAAYRGFLQPRPLEAPLKGLLINAAASSINAAWYFILLKAGKRLRSPALIADAKHLWTDVVTSAGVLVGVALVWLTNQPFLDPLIAAMVAVNILWAGWKLMRSSVGGLMDEVVPEETLAKIREIISSHAEGALEAHDLRTRQAGRAIFIDFHLVVPGNMTVSESHMLCDKIEAALRKEISDIMISIHVEPEEKAKHPGGVPVVG